LCPHIKKNIDLLFFFLGFIYTIFKKEFLFFFLVNYEVFLFFVFKSKNNINMEDKRLKERNKNFSSGKFFLN
jgi:hypothetical protein